MVQSQIAWQQGWKEVEKKKEIKNIKSEKFYEKPPFTDKITQNYNMDELNGNGKRGLPKLREILRRQKQDSEVGMKNTRERKILMKTSCF